MNETFYNDLISQGTSWLSQTYKEEGLISTLVIIFIGTIFFGGLGLLFAAAAKANHDSMNKHKEENDTEDNTND